MGIVNVIIKKYVIPSISCISLYFTICNCQDDNKKKDKHSKTSPRHHLNLKLKHNLKHNNVNTSNDDELTDVQIEICEKCLKEIFTDKYKNCISVKYLKSCPTIHLKKNIEKYIDDICKKTSEEIGNKTGENVHIDRIKNAIDEYYISISEYKKENIIERCTKFFNDLNISISDIQKIAQNIKNMKECSMRNMDILDDSYNFNFVIDDNDASVLTIIYGDIFNSIGFAKRGDKFNLTIDNEKIYLKGNTGSLKDKYLMIIFEKKELFKKSFKWDDSSMCFIYDPE